MIVRIQGEGQFRMPSAVLDDLNDLDNRLVHIVATGNAKEFDKTLGEMIALVRSRGQVVPMEELVESDIVIPASDITLDDAQHLFVGEGLVPG